MILNVVQCEKCGRDMKVAPDISRKFPGLWRMLFRHHLIMSKTRSEVGEKGFLESRSPTFWIDSSRKGHVRRPALRVPTGSRRQTWAGCKIVF
ncbi:hypothetical protein TNCV_1777451 [Trichonephila clavipes]|nr:hypothetical protein TNCV_1777451 [Trichonephila clavipes]